MDADITTIQDILEDRQDVIFAYVHGSVLHSESPGDIDVAVYVDSDVHHQLSERGEVSLSFAIPLEMELEQHVDLPVDLQILNSAPLAFKYRVRSTGKVIVDKNPTMRADFESLACVEYFDFRPRREEYLREALK